MPKDSGVDAGTELLRVIIHGILHLCGINDKGPGEREIMEQAEKQRPSHSSITWGRKLTLDDEFRF